MVRIVGWVPTLRQEEPSRLLNEFVDIFEADPDGEQDYPMKRSGHRCFTDNDYLYLIGGYCTVPRRRGQIFKELWAMSLVTFEWRRYQINGDFPEKLASFAIVQLAPYSKSFLLFGGSSTSFGASSSNSLHLIQVNNDDCEVTSRLLTVDGTPPRPIYGHAMCAGEVPGKYYIVGGTEGNIFNFDVTSVIMKPNPTAGEGEDKFTWHYEQVSTNEGLAGRYRLEAIYEETMNSLLFFGGGNSQQVFGFDKITKLNVTTLISDDLSTNPDPLHGFPNARRCHTLVRYGKDVIITGGVSVTADQNPDPHYSDVWSLNLENLTWKKFEQALPKSVFFHDSVVTKDGWLLTFGGVYGLSVTSPRTNMLVGACVGVPTLQRFALETLRQSYPYMFAGLYCGNFCQSGVMDIVMAFLKPGVVREKERKIIEEGIVKFHEENDRSRVYLNEIGTKFMIPPAEEPTAAARRRRILLEQLEAHLERGRVDPAEDMDFPPDVLNAFLRRGFQHAFDRIFPPNPEVEVLDGSDNSDDDENEAFLLRLADRAQQNDPRAPERQ